jgi:hypothetical protein
MDFRRQTGAQHTPATSWWGCPTHVREPRDAPWSGLTDARPCTHPRGRSVAARRLWSRGPGTPRVTKWSLTSLC